MNDGGRQGRLLLAAVLIGSGALLLVMRQLDWRLSEHFWPFFVIVPGAALLVFATMLPGRESPPLAAAGGVVAGTGLILLAQSLTDYYQSWAYAWALLPVFAGLGLLLAARGGADPSSAATGRAMILVGGVMFIVFAAAFEGLIFNGGIIAGDLALPIILIALGLIVLAAGAISFANRDGRSGRA